MVSTSGSAPLEAFDQLSIEPRTTSGSSRRYAPTPPIYPTFVPSLRRALAREKRSQFQPLVVTSGIARPSRAPRSGQAQASRSVTPTRYLAPAQVGTLAAVLERLLLIGSFLVGCNAGDPSAPPPSTPPAAEASPVEPVATPSEDATPEEVETAAPIPAKINESYVKQADAKTWAKRFEREGREPFDHRDDILAAIAVQPGNAVADVGIGSGLFTLEFAKAVGDGGKVFAVDVQDYFLDHVRGRVEEAKLSNVTFVKAGQRSAKLEADSVDVAFMCDVFHHVEYPKAYLASLFAAVKPGGRLVIIDFNAEPDVAEDWIIEHVRATPSQFRAEIEAAGFEFRVAHEILKQNFFYEFARPAN